MATAGIPSSAARPTRVLMRAAPSRREYWVWQWRWQNSGIGCGGGRGDRRKTYAARNRRRPAASSRVDKSVGSDDRGIGGSDDRLTPPPIVRRTDPPTNRPPDSPILLVYLDRYHLGDRYSW